MADPLDVLVKKVREGTALTEAQKELLYRLSDKLQQQREQLQTIDRVLGIREQQILDCFHPENPSGARYHLLLATLRKKARAYVEHHPDPRYKPT